MLCHVVVGVNPEKNYNNFISSMCTFGLNFSGLKQRFSEFYNLSLRGGTREFLHFEDHDFMFGVNLCNWLLTIIHVYSKQYG